MSFARGWRCLHLYTELSTQTTVALILVDWQSLPNQSTYPFEGMLALIVRSRRLLFEGAMVYPLPQAYKWAIMKPVLQTCGILQWVTFYALSLVF